jgi:hypothetical protein
MVGWVVAAVMTRYALSLCYYPCNMSAIRTLLSESIDYAGLFPPASLDMATAVQNYARYRREPAAWALGRFVVPVSRLQEFEAAAARPLVETPTGRPWRLALLAGPDLAGDLKMTAEFNRRHSQPGAPAALADTIEAKASSVAGIEDIMHRMSGTLQAYIEIPIDRDPHDLLAAVHRLGGRAKVRTGGVTGDAFPTTSNLIRFLRGCVQAALPFKATAGLHHPLRAEYRLTYAPDSPVGVMFGFLNLFLTTAFLRAGIDETDASRLLEEGSPEAFQIDEGGIAWRGRRLDLDALRDARRSGVVSFGSCSFSEPIGDLEALHLLGAGVRQA